MLQKAVPSNNRLDVAWCAEKQLTARMSEAVVRARQACLGRARAAEVVGVFVILLDESRSLELTQ